MQKDDCSALSRLGGRHRDETHYSFGLVPVADALPACCRWMIPSIRIHDLACIAWPATAAARAFPRDGGGLLAVNVNHVAREFVLFGTIRHHQHLVARPVPEAQ